MGEEDSQTAVSADNLLLGAGLRFYDFDDRVR